MSGLCDLLEKFQNMIGRGGLWYRTEYLVVIFPHFVVNFRGPMANQHVRVPKFFCGNWRLVALVIMIRYAKLLRKLPFQSQLPEPFFRTVMICSGKSLAGHEPSVLFGVWCVL